MDRSGLLLDVLNQAFGSGQDKLDDALYRTVEQHLQWIRLRGKEVLFREGDPSDSMYVVVSGRLRVVGLDQSGNTMSRDIARGELLGEMGVISGEPRSMTVYAVRDSALAMLPKSAFQALMSQHPQVMMGILRTLVLRLRRPPSTGPGPTASSAVAVVPLGSEPLDAARRGPDADFAGRLAAALKVLGPTLLLERRLVEERLQSPGAADAPPESPEGARLAAWLDEQELAHRFLVYQADAEAGAWTRRCIRQADHVLLAAMATSDPASPERRAASLERRAALREAERALIWTDEGIASPQRSLALLHPDGRSLPTGTARWLESRPVHRHYHVRCDLEADFGRLARSLTERGVGLVLGGGGARSFSQVGVIRALREHNIPIDFVGGTSMGAIVSAACAMGWDHATMVRLGRQAFVESKAFSEYTLPLISIIRGRRLDRVNRTFFGDTQIEDLWIPQFSVSCNLTTGELVVHRRGSLLTAVRASGSLPGVLAPVVDKGELLVDGGVLDNLPGDIMRSMSGGPMIVVNTTPEEDLRAECDSVPSPWQMLWRRLRSGPGAAGMPGILPILMRASTLGSLRAAKAAKSDADLYLHPPIQQFGLMDFEAIDQIVEVGYRYALRHIEVSGGRKKLCPASS